MSKEPGTLYIVGGPIGNLQDVTLRALEILKNVDAVYAEDTRVTRKLLDRYSISKPLLSYREAAEPYMVQKAIDGILFRLKSGESIAYLSDAGTPGVSDPGNHLVRKVGEAGYTITPIPGASALATLLSVSGLPVARPLFVGFLPKKKGRQTLLGQLEKGLAEGLIDSIVVYESPERIVRTLREISEWKLTTRVVIGRELTKMHEEIIRGTTVDVLKDLSKRPSIKGEFSLVISATA